MDYVYEYLVAAIVVSVVMFLSYFRKRTITTKLSTAFATLIISIFFSAFFKLLGCHSVKHLRSSFIPFSYFFISANLIFMMCISISFYYCIVAFIESDKLVIASKPPVRRRILIYITAVTTLIILSTPLTKLVYYFDKTGSYQSGILHFLPNLVCTLFFIACLFTTFFHRKEFNRSQIDIIISYCIGVILTLVIQVFFERLMIVELFSVIISIPIYLSFENPSYYQDNEMHVFNKVGFRIVSQHLLEKEKKFTVILIRFTGIKYLNNTIGTDNYKFLMKKISAKVYDSCKTKNIFRMSQTKVAVILEDDKFDINFVIQKLNDNFSEPFEVDGNFVSVQIRLVTLKCPENACEVEEIIKVLDFSSNRIDHYEPGYVLEANKSLIETKDKEIKILSILKNGIQKDEFYVVYQPIYNTEKKKFTTAEALIRLSNSDLGKLIGPDVFIPLAEQNGMILRIGDFVFNKVCQFIYKEKLWEKGVEFVHVNLSVIQCMQEALHSQLIEIMDSYHLDHSLISLEVTETTAVASSEILKYNMENLIEKGLHFALDDFGSGFSNISSLINYPFKTIKLDKTIIDICCDDERARTMVKNTIAMVKSLNMEIVAEGVETKEQYDFLYDCGCDYIQGYYFAKPLTETDYIEFIKKNDAE